jgi:hypothetical protein
MGRNLLSGLALGAKRTTRSQYFQGSGPIEQKVTGGNSDSRTELRSTVQAQFMRMMESHDRVRARVLGFDEPKSYSVSGD